MFLALGVRPVALTLLGRPLRQAGRQVRDDTGAVQAALQGHTAFVIAHRLSTIQRADRIVVLDQGKIAEMGTHAHLLALGGLYARLHAMQFGQAHSPA